MQANKLEILAPAWAEFEEIAEYHLLEVGPYMYFKSERSLGVAIFYFLLPLGGITLFTLLAYIGLHSIRWFLIYPLCLILLADAVSIWMWFDTGYTITDSQLKIKCSPFRKNIDLKTIESIKKIRSLINNLHFHLIGFKYLVEYVFRLKTRKSFWKS
jgi:uncharacterized membrane protein YdbT with pleckstrin-like domain